jgi:uroporphyrinogen decarboxylase
MTSKERIGIVLEGGIPDRVPMHDGYWDETLSRWVDEGLPKEIADDREAIWDFFAMEIRMISVDCSYLFEEKIVDEDERYLIKATKNGTVLKYIKNKTSTPGLVSFPVSSRDDWERLKPRLRETRGRLPANLKDLYQHYVDDGRFIVVCVHDPYEASWSKLGPTRLLEIMKTDPDFVRDIFSTIIDLNISVCEELLNQGYQVDGAWIWGDIAYSKSTFFSPHMYKQTLYPFHRQLIGFFSECGLPVVYHSDGNLNQVIELLIEAGVRCLQPLEAKAGMDLLALKQQYGGKLVFMGNVDFEKIEHGMRAMEEEIKLKVGLGKQGGGYIYHSDHSVPPKVSLEAYKSILDMVKRHGCY